MGYYGRYRYRSWRHRGGRASKPVSKYTILSNLFGSAVGQIVRAFKNLEADALEELFSDYGAIYGEQAEKYARRTYPKWKSGETKLSGQTMERLVELTPPYLTPQQRFSILQSVLKKHKKEGTNKTIRIDIKSPENGFSALDQVLESMSHKDVLAHLPESVMNAASWLYDDDITASRAMLAEAERIENDMVRDKAAREIALLRRTIASGQVNSASYVVELPTGKIGVLAYTPSKCYVATVCFGECAWETKALRYWRDAYLIEREWGRNFVVWYYNNGENIASIASHSPILRTLSKSLLRFVAKLIRQKDCS